MSSSIGSVEGGQFCPFPRGWYPPGDPCAKAEGFWLPAPTPGLTPESGAPAASGCVWCQAAQLLILIGLIGLGWYWWRQAQP